MAQFPKPKIVFNGILRAGEGLACFRKDFEVYTVDVTSSKIFDGPKPIVPHTTEYTTAGQRFVSSLSGFTKSTCIRTSDGVPIIWFIKQGMTSPWGHIGQFLFKATISALQILMSIYAPPRNIMGDPRHVWNFREEVARYEAQGRPYGVYVSILMTTGRTVSLTCHSTGPIGLLRDSRDLWCLPRRIRAQYAVTTHLSTIFSGRGGCISLSASGSRPSIQRCGRSTGHVAND